MKILKDAIISNSRDGRITLQIPQNNISFKRVEYETEEVPDEWVVMLRKYKYPAVGTEDGYLFLTRTGWNINKDKIEEAFRTARFKRGTWQRFVQHAEEHFKLVEKSTLKRIKFLERKVEKIRSAMHVILKEG
jgi:uncharacterized C2H2 Zn-finger protein